MAFLSGIFGSSTPAPAAAPAAAPVAATPPAAAAIQQQPAGGLNPAANPATMPGAEGQPNAGGPVALTHATTLDAFSNLFKAAPANPNVQRQPTLNDPILAPIDPAAFQEQVKSANFAAAIPQDVLSRAVSGDVGAFQEAIAIATREAFTAASTMAHGLAESSSREAARRVDAGLDVRVRNNLIRTQNSDNPALQHPSAAPMVNAVKAQIAAQNPQLSPQDVQQAAENYFTNFVATFQQPAKQQATQAAATTAKAGDFSYLLEN